MIYATDIKIHLNCLSLSLQLHLYFFLFYMNILETLSQTTFLHMQTIVGSFLSWIFSWMVHKTRILFVLHFSFMKASVMNRLNYSFNLYWLYIASQRLIDKWIWKITVCISLSENSKTSGEKILHFWKFGYCYLHTFDDFSSKNQNIWSRESKVIQVQRIFPIW